MSEPWWIGLIKAAIIINVLMLAMAFTTLLERKLLGRMQLRYGPNRAGPKGLLQPFADLMKMVRKEAFAPVAAIDFLYIAAPAFSAFTALPALERDPVGRGVERLALARERRGRRREYLADPDLRPRLARDLRLHRRRLGLRVEVLAARLDADVRADGLVRGLARAVRPRRRPDGALALARRHRQRPDRLGLVRGAAARRPHLSSSLPGSPRRTVRRSTSPRPTRSSSAGTTPSTRGCAGACSRWPST